MSSYEELKASTKQEEMYRENENNLNDFGTGTCGECGGAVDLATLFRGLCRECAPRCQAEFCDGILLLQCADMAICDACNTIHLLNDNGEWILKET